MKCFSLRLRFELAGAMLLAALFAPLALQAEDELFDAPAAAPVARKPLRAQAVQAVKEGEEAIEEEKADVEEATREGAEEKKKDVAEEEPEVVRPPAAPVNPRVVRFHLMDGSMVSGELTIDQISVATEFGELVIPIPALSSFTPGLGSYPTVATGIDELVEKLGSDDYQTREQAHKDLGRMGLKVRRQLEAKKSDENAERKRHVEQLLKDMESLAEEQAELAEEGEAEAVTEWIDDDTVVTNQFAMVGKISPQEFVMKSKYGPLNVKLSDIRKMDREQAGQEAVVRRVEVSGTHLAQMSYKDSGIRVEAGDKVTITADGQLVMSPWGNNMSSGPEGGQNFGWYVANKIPGGALIGKIGNSNEEFKIGGKYSFTAKRSGMLKLAIAMQAQYAQQGYSFPGQYNVRVKVEGQ
jgi:hypothetical protein